MQTRQVHGSTPRRRMRPRAVLALAATTVIVLIAVSVPGLRLGGNELPGLRAVAGGAEAAGPGGLTAADGYLPPGGSLSPFSHAPAIARLAPDLRAAIHRAAADARADGIPMRVDSGWRSPRYQRELLRRAIETHGSLRIARRYVLPPSESSHVSGEAVDIGPTDADSWLSIHGSEYGLCQIYANEMWHFELATTPGGTCPPMAADATAG